MKSFHDHLKFFLKAITNYHKPGKKKDVYIFSVPRAGSTWLMELIASQPGFKYYDEPFNIRRDNVQRTGLFNSWEFTIPGYAEKNIVFNFLNDLKKNKYKYMNPPPFRRNHRFSTNRIVFKIHEIEHLINEIKDRLNGKIVFLIRHPIANTLSRHQLPRLEYFVNSGYFREKYLTNEQSRAMNNIYSTGSEFEKGILSWCLQNLIPLKFSDRKDWLFISYEELLLNPHKCCNMLFRELELVNLPRMLKSFNIPASNIAISSEDTLKIFQSSEQTSKNLNLVTKWKKKITYQQENTAFQIIQIFKIDVYEKNNFIPASKYLVFDDTAHIKF